MPLTDLSFLGCPKPVILAIVLGVIGGIVGLGVLLLVIWKILMTLYDRREYKMFLKESESARFNEVLIAINNRANFNGFNLRMI